MKIVAKPVKPVTMYTYSIEDLTAREAAAVALAMGRCNKKLGQATYNIYSDLMDRLESTSVSIEDFDFDKD